jgi:hypothetical protein
MAHLPPRRWNARTDAGKVTALLARVNRPDEALLIDLTEAMMMKLSR